MSDNAELPTLPEEGNDFVDLNSHQELLDSIKNATSEVLNAAGKFNESAEMLEEHNLDANAHPGIQQMIKDVVDSGTTETVDNRIADHNVSTSAHLDLRTLIEQAKQDTATATKVANDLVTAHNSDATAHSDMREAINNLKTQVGDSNLQEINTKIDNLETSIKEDLSKDIEQLQSVDARHDSEIATNRNGISTLEKRLTNLATDIVNVANSVTTSSSTLDEVTLKAYCLDREAVLGYTVYNEQGPVLANLENTIPIYVSHNKTSTFIFTEAKDIGGGTNVKMSIEQGKGDYTISPLSDIGLGDAINMNVGGGGNAGDILDFTVAFTDGTNSQQCKRVFAVMLAKPLSQGSLSINGLPTGVEPGATFEIQISNLTDDGSGRYSYSLDVMTSGITFSKTSEITETDIINTKIPEGAPREQELTFKLIVHDSYGIDQEYEFSVYVNALPSTDDFEHNVPGTVIPNGSYTIHFDGITSAQGNKAKYNIKKDESGKLTFSKYDNILANENVTMTVAGDVVRGETYTFIINTIDENEVSVQVQLSTLINILPLSNDITTTLPASTQGGKTLAFKISGGSDTEQPVRTESGRSVVSYAIDAASSSFNFSKITNIAPTDEVQVTVPKVASDDVRTFNIYAVDNLGERSQSPKVVSITLEPIYLLSTPTIITPTEGSELQYDDGVDITWTEFAYTTDMRSLDNVVYTY